MTVRCPMSDLPVDQCALPCHRGVDLPAGVAPEVRRGVEPSGRVTVLTLPADQQHEALDTRRRPRRGKRLERCRWDGDLEEWVLPEHVRDCKSLTCRGCKPCGKDHCAMRGTCPNHVEHDAGINTCPQCIGETRDDVGEIETLAALVDSEVVHALIESEVVNLAGPFADPGQRSARRAFDDARGMCDWPRADIYVIDQHHPAAVFARWETKLRTLYGQAPADTEPLPWPLPHRQERRPLSQAADYFRWMLSTGMPHDDVFVPYARAMHDLRTHLEEALSDSRRPEQGAPCLACANENPGHKPPALEKRHGHWCTDPECKRQYHHSTVVDDDGVERPDTSGDFWICPANSRHRWSDEDYRKYVQGGHRAHAKKLTAAAIWEQYHVNPSTLRTWVARGEVKKCGVNWEGRILYDVAQVRARAKTVDNSSRGA